MMPFNSKMGFQNDNAIESQLDLHNSSQKIAMTFNNIVPIKTPLEIKTENGGICEERENSNDSQSPCLNCQNLQQKLKISRGWNRFYREKVINVDKVLHIISEFEREKQKNLELQLAYDQRSREWSQQQEQLINLLTEVQPLREKLKIAEATLDREIKERQKHQYMEESLKVTIQQLQAKVSHMNTIANPIFVENLEKKLNTSRSEIKKVKCNLEFKKAEVAELRSYITDKNIQVENLSKKLYWAFELANKYIKNEPEDEENALERNVLKHQTEGILQFLNALYNTFYTKKKKEYKEKQIPLACLPSFSQWSSDFEKKACEEENQEDEDFIIKKESSKFEKEASELEKLLSDVTVEEAFANISKQDTTDYSVIHSSSESPSKVNGDKNNEFLKETIKKEIKKIPSTKKRKRITTKICKQYLSPSPKKTNISKSTEDVKGFKTESVAKLEKNCVLFKNLMDKSFPTPKKSINKSYETPNKPVSSTQNKSSRKKSIRKHDPQTPEITKHVLSDLHLSDSSFISDSSESDMDDISLSKVKESLSLKSNKSSKKLIVPFDDREPISGKSRKSYDYNSTGNLNTANDSDDESTKRMKDLAPIRKMISVLTVPPLELFAYSEDTDSSPDLGSQVKSAISSKEPTKYTTPPNSPISNVKNESLNSKTDFEDKNKVTGSKIDHKVRPVKTLPIRKLSLPKRKLCRVEDDDKSFVPQRVTRSSYKRQKQDIVVSADIKHQQEDKTIKKSLPQKIEDTVLSVSESSKESHFKSPSPIRHRTRSRNNSKTSIKLTDEASPKNHSPKDTPSPDATCNSISLDLNLSVSSSNTDTEESDIDKIVNRKSDSSIKYIQDVSSPTHEFDSSTPSKSTSLNLIKEMEGKSERNDSYEMTNPVLSENENYKDELSSQKLAEHLLTENKNYEDKLSSPKKFKHLLPENENYEDRLSFQKNVDHLLPDKIIEENSENALSYLTVSCDNEDVKDGKIKEINNHSYQNCSLIRNEILNVKDNIPISPISSPVKRPDLKSNQRNTQEDCSEKKVSYDVSEHQTLLEENSTVVTMKSILNMNPPQEKVSSSKVAEDYNSINTILEADVFDEIGEAPVFQSNENVSSKVNKDHNSISTVKETSVSVPHEKVSSNTDEELNFTSTTLILKATDQIEETLTFESNKKINENYNSTAVATKTVEGIEKALTFESEKKNSSEVDIDHNSNSAILSAQFPDGIEEASVSNPQGNVSSDVEDLKSNSDKLAAKVAYEIKEEPVSELNRKISSEVYEDHNFDSTTKAAKVTDGIEEAPVSELREKVSFSVDEDHDSSNSVLAANVVDGIKESPFSESKLCKRESEEEILTINLNKNLFSDDLDESSSSLLDIVSVKRTVSESSTESVALSDISVDNKGLNIISENKSRNKSASKDPLNHSWEENDEISLVMDIDDTELIENKSDRLESSDEENYSVAEIKKKQIELKPLELKIDSENNFGKNTTVQESEPSSFSFYKERRNIPEHTDFQIPNIIFSENSTAEDEKKSIVKRSKKNNYSSFKFPLIKSHPDFQEATFKVEESYMNSENLQEYFQDILGCYIGGTDWNDHIENIITYISSINSPNVMGKFQPIIRNILVSVLRSSPCEKLDPKYAIPPTILKLFHVVRILEKKFVLPDFALDSLVNISAHKLILTRKLRPNSLASLTTWVMSSCNAQYNKLGKPNDEESLRWGRSFLTDLLFHHKGFAHESLLSAVSSSRRILIRIVKYRESTNLEKLIFWIAHYGDWEGPKVTRANLIQAFTTKLGLHKPPNVNPTDVIKDILRLLIDKKADEDELSSCKAAFLLYLKWIPLVTIIKSLFPELKNVYYEEEVILNKYSLPDVKSSIEAFVKLVKWDEESEMKFLQHLKCFPIIKN